MIDPLVAGSLALVLHPMLRWSLEAPSPFGKELARFRFAEHAVITWQSGSVFLNKGELGMEIEKRFVNNARRQSSLTKFER